MPAPAYRLGHGYDIHRTSPGRPLVLGGVTIAAPFGLEGHSDADCLTHALADAILGAVAQPDIGHFFPNSDPSLRGIDSQVILARAAAEAERLGYRVAQADLSLVAEAPRIAPHRDAMRARLAATLGLSPDRIGLKATTNEGCDAVGRGEAVAAWAVVLLERIP